MLNSDGTWVKLDRETMQHYCHEAEGEAWSLARGADDIVYLKHESELLNEEEEEKKSAGQLRIVRVKGGKKRAPIILSWFLVQLGHRRRRKSFLTWLDGPVARGSRFSGFLFISGNSVLAEILLAR